MALSCHVGKSKPLIDVVNAYLLYTYQQDSEKYLPAYLKMAMDVYSDLNFNVLTSEVREIMTIDKKLGAIKVPDNAMYWLNIAAINDDGTMIPLLENNSKVLPNFKEEIIPVSCPNPKCKSDLCADVRSVTAVSEVVVIDGTEYTNVTQTQVNPDGSIIRETCKWYPKLQSTTNNEVFIPVEINGGSFAVQFEFNKININGNEIECRTTLITVSDITTLITNLNNLGFGTFTYSVEANGITITSNSNTNALNYVYIIPNMQSPATYYFRVEPGPIVNNGVAQKICTTEQICKVDLDEDGCIEDTPANKEVISESCVCVPMCCKYPKKEVPTVSYNDGYIYFSNMNYGRVVLTYKTSGINFGQVVMVPEVAEQAIVSGIAYYSIKHKRNASISDKENARKYYNIDRKKLIEKMYPIRMQELINAAHITSVIW